MGSIRVFIAVSLPGTIQQELSNISARLRYQMEKDVIRWVNTANIHLTLRFLGEMDEAQLEPLVKELNTQIPQHAPFDMTVQTLGAFPNLKHPRVLWVGIAETTGLKNLQREVENITQLLGYPAEGWPFSAHLTLGRVNQRANTKQISHCGALLSSMKINKVGIFNVKSIEIYKSHLTPDGSVYTKMYSFPMIEKPNDRGVN